MVMDVADHPDTGPKDPAHVGVAAVLKNSVGSAAAAANNAAAVVVVGGGCQQNDRLDIVGTLGRNRGVVVVVDGTPVDYKNRPATRSSRTRSDLQPPLASSRRAA